MSFISAGSDVGLTQNKGTGKWDFDFDTSGLNSGNPRYTDDNLHRIMSLLMEHRASSASQSAPSSPGWIWDTIGNRGSLLYTIKNARKATPSQAEAFAIDALDKAVKEGWITAPRVTARKSDDRSRLILDVSWTNPDRSIGSLRVPLEP